MNLPNRSEAYVPPAKLHHYLLSLTHSTGQSKARFFHQFGFRKANAVLLETELLLLAQTGDVLFEVETPFGVKYIIDGSLQTPSNAIVTVRTIWIIEHNERRPRFVTAYPKSE